MQGICLQCGEMRSISPHHKLCNKCRKANLNHVLILLREERNELLCVLKDVLGKTARDHDKWPMEYAKASAVYLEISSKVKKFDV